MKRYTPLALSLFALTFSSPTSSQEFVHDWLILGEFTSSEGGPMLNKDFLAGEAKVIPQAGTKASGKIWFRYHSDENDLDLLQEDLPFEIRENAVAYFGTFIFSPIAQKGRLLLGSDDGVAVWLNGSKIHLNEVSRGVSTDDDTVAVSLGEGWNTLLMKVHNGGGRWGVCARVADAEGLKYSTHNPALVPVRNDTPYDILGCDLGAGFLLDSTNQAFLSSKVTVIRTPARSPAPVKLLLQNQQSKTVATYGLPDLIEGETSTLNIPLPIDLALAAASQNKPLNFVIRHGKAKTAIHLPAFPPTELLKLWFQPWKMDGWQMKTENGQVVFTRTLVVPDKLKGFELAAMIDIGDTWGAFKVDGQVVQPRFSGDSGDILITKSAGAGARHELRVEITKPSSEPVKIRKSALVLHHELMENYLGSVQYSKMFTGIDVPQSEETAIELVRLLRAGRIAESGTALQSLMGQIQKNTPQMKDYTVSLLGNAHIDLMWLWRYPETIEVCKQTFAAALDNMRRFPDFRFAFGQAHAYDWMEQYAPEIFAEIKERVASGQWEVIGGAWCQPDKNMPSGESVVRQYLYGKKYFKDKFGVDVRVGWMPDTFGHAGSLPQILKKCGIDYYVFFRPWEDERIFHWQSPDGSTVLGYRPPNWYNSGVSKDVGKLPFATEKSFGIKNTLRCYGVGDHGGGPTVRDIKLAKQLDRTTAYPNVKFANIHQYFQELEPQAAKLDTLRDEINFVFDGCWTSQAMTKRYNRHLEALLPTAETFSFFAQEHGSAYPQHAIEQAWRHTLFNQFHDIFDGSGIAAIYPDAQIFYDKADSIGKQVLAQAVANIAKDVNTTPPKKGLLPVVVFNSLNWSRSEPITVDLPAEANQSLQFFDGQGKALKSCRLGDGKWQVQAADISPLGYGTLFYKIVRAKKTAQPKQNLVLENAFLRVEIDAKTGQISRIFDRPLSREVLRSPGNALQLQEDNNKSMTAWTIKLKGPIATLSAPTSVQVVEANELRQVVRVKYAAASSKFEQDILLYADMPRVDFTLRVDWHHRDTMLKVAFPLNLQGQATFETPYGHIVRQQQPREVVSQKWVDVSDADWGVSLLNDCKYGFDVNDNTIRMSALRSPHDPDPKADEGRHEMHYALYPHNGDWKSGGTVQAAWAYNTPLVALPTVSHAGSMPASHSFLQVSGENVVVAACKKSEYSDALILRLFETAGKPGQANLSLNQPATQVSEVNMIEAEPVDLRLSGKSFSIALQPYEVKTVAIQ